MPINQPRIVWSTVPLSNPSFDAEGDVGVLPFNWVKLGDGDDSSTFKKESGARETELGLFRAENEVLGTDTLCTNSQEVPILVADLAVGDKYFLGCWLKTTGAVSGIVKVATETSGDADIDAASQAFSYGAAQDWIFVSAIVTLASLGAYDHFRVTIRNDSTGAVLYIDDCVFGKVLDFPIIAGNPGVADIPNLIQRQAVAIDNFSLSGVGESLRSGRPFWEFEMQIRNFRQDFYDDLFAMWKTIRKGGNNRFAYFLDKDSFDLVDFHYPYLVVTAPDWSPEVHPGLLRYTISIPVRTVLPFEIQ